MTVGHDSLDAHAGGFEQRGEKLVGKWRRQVSEEVEWDQLKASSCKAIQVCSQASSNSIFPSRLRDDPDGILRWSGHLAFYLPLQILWNSFGSSLAVPFENFLDGIFDWDFGNLLEGIFFLMLENLLEVIFAMSCFLWDIICVATGRLRF